MVCGAGNEDKDEVEYLSYVYTLAGCAGFDVSASPEIVKSAKKGINAALIKAHELKIDIPFYSIYNSKCRDAREIIIPR